MRTQLHHLLDQPARTGDDPPAVTDRHRALGYGALACEVHALAAGLRGLGVQRGDRVAIWLDQRVEAVVAIFAASAAGLVLVPVNPVLKPAQVRHVLTDCDARVLLTSGQRWRQLDSEVTLPAGLEHLVTLGSRTAAATGVDHHSYDALVAAGGWAAPSGPAVHPGVDSDIAAILYTSGSTGSPKGVVLTHRNLVVGAESVSSYLGHDADDVVLALLPLSFDAGLSQVTTAFAVGAHVVLADYLLPGDVVRLCADHGVTGLTCVPPLWLQLVAVPWPEDATHLRYFANTGGRMPAHLLGRLRALFPDAAPYLMYGLTEAFRSTYLDPAEVDARPGSIGRAVPDAEILVVRPDGTIAAPGEEGELVHRGPSVALGYWNDTERTAERFRPVPGPTPPWRSPELAVWSGDTVVTDEDGFLYFVGRVDDMIKTSGYRVSPTEVEEAAYATGLVGEAAALGVDDDALGQRIVLVATGSSPATGLDVPALLAALRRTLPRFMVPSEVRAMGALPRSPHGKLDRTLLRKEVS